MLNRHDGPVPWTVPRTAAASGGEGGMVPCCHSKLYPGAYTQSRMACQSASCLPRPARSFSSSPENHLAPSLDCRTSLSLSLGCGSECHTAECLVWGQAQCLCSHDPSVSSAQPEQRRTGKLSTRCCCEASDHRIPSREPATSKLYNWEQWYCTYASPSLQVKNTLACLSPSLCGGRTFFPVLRRELD